MRILFLNKSKPLLQKSKTLLLPNLHIQFDLCEEDIIIRYHSFDLFFSVFLNIRIPLNARHISAPRLFPFSFDAVVIYHLGEDFVNCYLSQPSGSCFRPSCYRTTSEFQDPPSLGNPLYAFEANFQSCTLASDDVPAGLPFAPRTCGFAALISSSTAPRFSPVGRASSTTTYCPTPLDERILNSSIPDTQAGTAYSCPKPFSSPAPAALRPPYVFEANFQPARRFLR